MATIDPMQLSGEVAKILEKYRDDVSDAIDEASLKSANKCVKEVKANSSAAFGSGPYASGWTKKKTSSGRGRDGYTIHNKKPGLPHLLEYGHALHQGGRTDARSHIAPAEKNAIEYFEKAAREAIENVS